MNLIEQLVTHSDQSNGHLLDDSESVLWVDWRMEDDAIVNDCESLLKTGSLSAVWTDDQLLLRYAGTEKEVPLTETADDRHITLRALNELLAPEYELRMVWASDGSDTLAFVPLSASQWTDLEAKHGVAAVERAFFKLAKRPNVFTDPLHKHRPSSRPWWQFWK